MQNRKIVITGAAGLVGQNLIARLKARGRTNIVAIDKHPTNCNVLRQFHPDIQVIQTDLASGNDWQDSLAGCTALVSGNAQIGGLFKEEYVRNNVTASERLMEAAKLHGVPYVVNISSSVVNSMAVDNYTETKKAQEKLVLEAGIKQVILRPTLMFGWFDRKHVGWLARLMKKIPVFPIPGNGKYLRQPLFAGDFCDVIIASVEREITGAYNITGQERVDYIDLMTMVRNAVGAKARIVKIPYNAFYAMLKIAGIFDKNPAFTPKQLEALTTPDVFEVIDWPGIFGVRATPLQEALEITFRDPKYSSVVLDF
ncbi:NAD-dependent epimerase/dehydratase family protein [Terriglobus roseus]|uniref:Nucleoside-diphosphate-sugar epimerase n=1 Tax=Terriglobus roseus TaxID=392734 RepID=A0A1H4L1K7_9BACT|nr:NAD-dependent epimerase/dehydratase family protein [Terriglobus roseus]SEB64627.1 Nucleoside-diphosphate-sugar epimerase [Terriglobus roseus]